MREPNCHSYPPRLYALGGAIVAAARERRGWSQARLATEAGMGASTVGHVEAMGAPTHVLRGLDLALEDPTLRAHIVQLAEFDDRRRSLVDRIMAARERGDVTWPDVGARMGMGAKGARSTAILGFHLENLRRAYEAVLEIMEEKEGGDEQRS